MAEHRDVLEHYHMLGSNVINNANVTLFRNPNIPNLNNDISGNYFNSGDYYETDNNKLEDAYNGLLEQRNQLISPVLSTSGNMNEEELLINTNLQTATLFKRLNDEFKQKQKTLEIYNSDLKSVLDTPLKISNYMNSLKTVYMSTDPSTVDGLVTLINTSTTFFRDTNTKLSDMLRKKIAGLEGELDDINRKLTALRSLIITGVNDIVKTEDTTKKICPVCFDNEVSIALVPCGHTYCRGCAEVDKSRYAKCPQCRTQINARIKIFFSM
jgi:hypothetical protein